jgi:hypothetical protein
VIGPRLQEPGVLGIGPASLSTARAYLSVTGTVCPLQRPGWTSVALLIDTGNGGARAPRDAMRNIDAMRDGSFPVTNSRHIFTKAYR